MTHRTRRVGFLVVGMVLLGFVFNIITSRGAAAPAAATRSNLPSARTDARQPMVPLYVPQPASMVYGARLNAQSPADQVALAVAISYYTFDTSTDEPAEFTKALPRIASAAIPAIRERVTGQWKELDRASHVSSVVMEPDNLEASVSASGADGTVVQVALTQQTTRKGQQPITQQHVLSITMRRNLDRAGWNVTAIDDRG